MSRNLFCLTIFAMVVMAAPVGADTLSGLADVTVVDGAIVSLRNEGVEYVVADGDLVLGTTTRWYVVDGVETLWAEGDPAPAATVSGTSTPKDGDVGSKADNFLFTLDGSTNISSIDGIDFQETIFPLLTDTVFVFERNGNDNGTVQAILADGSLGEALTLTNRGEPYASTGVDVNGQTAYGYVLTTDVPVKGLRITASGHDALSISTPAPAPILVDPSSDLAAVTAEAQYGSRIILAEGTYVLTSQIGIKDGVTYKGAGAGLTIIDGNNATRAFVAWGDRGATSGQVDENGVAVPNTTGPKGWVLDGLTIQNCVADLVRRHDILGAARVLLNNYTADTPYTLEAAQQWADWAIWDNPGWFEVLSGGADDNLTDVELQAYLDNNPVGSAGHLVSDGEKDVDAGAINIDNGSVGTIANCEFLNNSTPDGGFADDGGAIEITGNSAVTITGCTFKGNHSLDDGGAIALEGLSTAILNDCLFDGNYAVSPDSVAVEGFDGDGGHMSVGGGSASAITPGTTLIANRCTFLNGNAEDDGGAIRTGAVGSIVRLDACWFEGNTSWDNGNVLAIGNESSGELTVTNCIFANNTTKSDNSPDRMCEVRRNSKFINCTFVGNNQNDQDLIYNNANNADTDADGTDDESADVTQVVNCIFLNNVVGNGDDVLGSRNASFTIAAINCLFSGNTLQNGSDADNTQRPDEETGSILADPLLDADHMPGVGSPAIDAGVDPATIGVTVTTDFAGNARPQGTAYDIGAYEAPAN